MVKLARRAIDLHVRCIVNNYGIYPLEFTSRFGYPCVSIQGGLAHADGRPAARARRGQHHACARAAGSRSACASWCRPSLQRPGDAGEHLKDSVILFKTPSREGIHIEDVRAEDGEWLVTGTSGVVLIVCGAG